MARSLSVSWYGLLTKCLEETPGSTVHAACVALPTPSSYKHHGQQHPGTNSPPRASSQPVLPAKFLQQDSFVSSLLSVYRIRQGKFQGAGIEQISWRPKELFPFIKPQPCPSSVGRILSPCVLSAISTKAAFNHFYSFKVLSYYPNLPYKPYYLHKLLLKLWLSFLTILKSSTLVQNS